MAATKTGSTRAIPDTSGSSQPQGRPATKVKNKGSSTSIVGSGDAGSSAQRSQFVPDIWGPGGTRPPWTPRARGTAGAKKNSWSQRPAASAGARDAPPQAAQAACKVPDEGSSSPRSQFVPTNIWGPDGRRSSWTPRARGTANTKKNSWSSHPAASARSRDVPPPAAQAAHKIPPQEPGSPLPKPEDVPVGPGVEMGSDMVEEVERQTRGQRRNRTWFAWRQNRITASIAHQVCHSRFANGSAKEPPVSYLKAITGETRGIKTRAMTWGIDNEDRAAREYRRLKSELLGRPVRVQDCGLFIHPKHSWLGASPDGIVVDAETGECLLCLEIKCPYKHRDCTVDEACVSDRQFCLELLPEAGEGELQYRLKTKHPYYTQVQCQMAVVGLQKTDFVVFTLHEIAIVPVTFDPEFWKSALSKMEFFYEHALMPFQWKKGNGAPPRRREE